MPSSVGTSAIDLYWLPLGAGGHSVRLNGRIFEWVAARIEHRDRCDLYHSALEIRVQEGRFVVEQAPAWSGLDVDSVALPTGGRAPGWRAGIVVARREQAIAALPATAGSR